MNSSTVVVLFALHALAAGAAFAQEGMLSNTSSGASASGHIEYRSTFAQYQPYREPVVDDWRAINATVGTLNGHAGHVGSGGRSSSATGSEAAKVPASTPAHGAPEAHGAHGAQR